MSLQIKSFIGFTYTMVSLSDGFEPEFHLLPDHVSLHQQGYPACDLRSLGIDVSSDLLYPGQEL